MHWTTSNLGLSLPAPNTVLKYPRSITTFAFAQLTIHSSFIDKHKAKKHPEWMGFNRSSLDYCNLQVYSPGIYSTLTKIKIRHANTFKTNDKFNNIQQQNLRPSSSAAQMENCTIFVIIALVRWIFNHFTGLNIFVPYNFHLKMFILT